MLTSQQAALFKFLTDFAEQNPGASPSYDQMAEQLGLRSKSGIHRLMRGLEERGFIRRLPGRVRGVEILKMPGRAMVVTPELMESAFLPVVAAVQSSDSAALGAAIKGVFRLAAEAAGVRVVFK